VHTESSTHRIEDLYRRFYPHLHTCLYSQRVRGGILRYINLLTYLGLLTDSRSWVDFTPATTRNIGVAWGCSGCTCTPKEGKIFFRRNLQGKCVSAPPRTRSAPQPEQESIFRTVFAGRVRFGGVFRRSLRATTKKGRQLFW